MICPVVVANEMSGLKGRRIPSLCRNQLNIHVGIGPRLESGDVDRFQISGVRSPSLEFQVRRASKVLDVIIMVPMFRARLEKDISLFSFTDDCSFMPCVSAILQDFYGAICE